MEILHLQLWQWAVLACGAFALGVSKTGIAGLGILSVATFALVLPSKQATGIVLPILISGDIIAVLTYRRHANWKTILRLLPWVALGVHLGYLALGRVNNQQVGQIIGFLLIGLLALQCWRMAQEKKHGELQVPDNIFFSGGTGIVAGFTTMIGNAAGPVMILYLLAMRLPMMEFLGTGAWYFLIVNCYKVPYNIKLGLISASSLLISAPLLPFSIAGALYGRAIVKHLNQQLFNNLALFLTLLAAIHLAGIDGFFVSLLRRL